MREQDLRRTCPRRTPVRGTCRRRGQPQRTPSSLQGSDTTSPTRQGTDWTLGLGLARLLLHCNGRATRPGDEGGEGHDEEDVNVVGLAGAGSALGPVVRGIPPTHGQPEWTTSSLHGVARRCRRGGARLRGRGTRAPPPLRRTRPLARRFNLGRDWSPRQSRRRRTRPNGWGRQGLGGHHGRAQDAHRHVQTVLHLICLRSLESKLRFTSVILD
nr:uncharacterized protein LOC120976312 isoform X2 [Aegilops tauschii subsp. strangulata]